MPLSIVLTVHDQAAELRRNLPLLLAQQYEPGFEVIVVDESSTDDTDDVLTQLKASYANLYSTYIPESSHYLSRRKLALTLGIKAARNEWIILTEADCHPEGEDWLGTMASYMTDEYDVVCGYTNYTPESKSWYIFLRMLNWWRQQSRPYRYDGAALAIRKSAFMARNGFLKNLKSLRGEYDYLVNETDRDRIAVVKPVCGCIRQEEPAPKDWKNIHLYYMDTRRRLHHAFWSRLWFVFVQFCIHLSYWLGLAALGIAAWKQEQALMAMAAGLLVLVVGWRTVFGCRLARACGEHIPLWKLPFLDIKVAWHYLYFWLRYIFSDKNDFLRK